MLAALLCVSPSPRKAFSWILHACSLRNTAACNPLLFRGQSYLALCGENKDSGLWSAPFSSLPLPKEGDTEKVEVQAGPPMGPLGFCFLPHTPRSMGHPLTVRKCITNEMGISHLPNTLSLMSERVKYKKELIEKVISTYNSGYTYYVVHMASSVNCRQPGDVAMSSLLLYSHSPSPASLAILLRAATCWMKVRT